MNNSNSLRNHLNFAATFALVVAAVLATHLAFAGGDSSDKGATQLMKAEAAGVPAPATPNAGALSCPRGQDATVTRVSTEKGDIQTSSVSRQHLCPACEQKLLTTGTGKAARTEVKPTCGYAKTTAASCCAGKSVGTKSTN